MTTKAEIRKHRVYQLAAKLAAEYYQEYLEYLAACKLYIQEGFTPHYCEHGVNMWTDYDPICGSCEQGLTMGDGVMRRSLALKRARDCYARAEVLIDVQEVLHEAGILIPEQNEAIWRMVARLLMIE